MQRFNVHLISVAIICFSCMAISVQTQEKTQPTKLIQIKKNDLYGYANAAGEIVITPQYEMAGDFSEGLARVDIEREDEIKSGFINEAGTIVIEPLFSDAKDFHEGLAAVQLEEKWGFINKSGEVIIQPRFEKDDIHDYRFSEHRLHLACY